jgi:hypothetical protein
MWIQPREEKLMRLRPALLVPLAASVTLTAVVAAGPDVAKQRVAVAAKGVLNQGMLNPAGFGEFVLTPLEAGELEPDSGTVTSVWRRVVVREGHGLETYDAVSTLLGRRGSVVLLERVDWGDTRGGSHSGPGSWKIIRGTGQYRQLAGAGRSGNAWLDRGPWSSRYEGFLVRR